MPSRENPHPVVQLCAIHRIARQVLQADLQNPKEVDKTIRLRILESAAGLRPGVWARKNPLSKGFVEAMGHFPEAHADWFSQDQEGVFTALAASIKRKMVGYEGYVDGVISKVVGEPKYLTKLGKALASHIESGGDLGQARRYITQIGKSRAKDWVDKRKRDDVSSGVTKSPKKRQKEIQYTSPEAMAEYLQIDSKLMTYFKREYLPRMKAGGDKDIMEMWADNPKLSNKDIGEALGLSPTNPSAPVGQAKKRHMERFLDDPEVDNYLAAKLQRFTDEGREFGRPKRAPSHETQGVGMSKMKWAAAMARRIAFRVLVADISNKNEMDKWIRAKLLESAAGLRYGTWSNHPDRGLAAASDHFPNADPDWFSSREQGLFGSLASAVNKSLGGYSSQDHDDVIMEIVGDPKHLAKQGKSLADKRKGIDSLGTARSHLATLGKSRATDWRRRRENWEGGQEAEHDRQRHEHAWKPLKSKELKFVEQAGDMLMADRKLMGLFKRDISGMSDTTKDIMEAWVRNPGKDNKDIGNDLGLSPSNPSAPVGQAKLKTFKEFFNRRDVLKYLRIRAEMAQAERAQYDKPTRAPSSDRGPGLGPMKWAESIKRVAAAFLANLD